MAAAQQMRILPLTSEPPTSGGTPSAMYLEAQAHMIAVNPWHGSARRQGVAMPGRPRPNPIDYACLPCIGVVELRLEAKNLATLHLTGLGVVAEL
jgi:hypothetical protein